QLKTEKSALTAEKAQLLPELHRLRLEKTELAASIDQVEAERKKLEAEQKRHDEALAVLQRRTRAHLKAERLLEDATLGKILLRVDGDAVIAEQGPAGPTRTPERFSPGNIPDW